MWKNIAGQSTYDNMSNAYCMLDTYGYKHPLRIYNIYSFSTATMATRERLIFYVIPTLSVLLYITESAFTARYEFNL